MSDRSVGHEVSRVLMRTAAAALVIPALLACGILSGGPAPTPTAPAGMFSTLPTTEPPIVGDEPGMVLKLAATPEPTPTPTPTPEQPHLNRRLHPNRLPRLR